MSRLNIEGLESYNTALSFSFEITFNSINQTLYQHERSSTGDVNVENEQYGRSNDNKRLRSKEIQQEQEVTWNSDINSASEDYFEMLESEGQKMVDSKTEEYEKIARVRGEQLAQDWQREKVSLAQAIDSCFAETLETRSEVHAIREHFERAARAVTTKVISKV